MRLVLVGPPGAGKGTQAEFIAEHFAIPKISTGDIFRANVSGGTELGQLAKKYMDAGDLVPDEVTNAMVRDRLGQDDARDGFLLDGFPRNVAQAGELDGILAALDSKLTVVLDLEVEPDEVVRRLSGRRTCKKCGHVWHIEFDPPSRPDVCDKCGGELYHRDDDYPETVRHRLEVYAAQTAPLIEFYGARGQVVSIDALGTVEDVTERAIGALTPFAG
ncbi:MAG TPA: adenylate kinase [Jatrophihabitantaceae bacterium]|jgi:adenylate kinase|nr:adenylate kinase [Jatrophihabitantaceae bacterium]